jgi:hypothetical protein
MERHATDEDMTPRGTGEFEGLPVGIEQWRRLCSFGYRDSITQRFCAGSMPPTITSLEELQRFLGFQLRDQQNTAVAMTGLSTGVGMRTVTPLNPRAIFLMPSRAVADYEGFFTILAFARGEPLVELVSRDQIANTLRFFVLRFHPACESTVTGCNFADLLTPSIEYDWTAYTLYDEQTIKNTPLDCLACHQRGGSSTRKILRMQEFSQPWNHWFEAGVSPLSKNREADFVAVHEVYAAVTVAELSSGGALEQFLRATQFEAQPNAYDSATINIEMQQMGVSYSWQALYEASVWGDAIAPPYFGIDQTDPAKVSPMISAYQRVMRGELPREMLPDIRDTLRDDALSSLSIRPKPGLDGYFILKQMCSRCHNSRLDQTQTRALFNVDTLDTLDPAEKQLAIARMNLPDNDRLKMPPPRFHVLSPAERDLAIQELSK